MESMHSSKHTSTWKQHSPPGGPGLSWVESSPEALKHLKHHLWGALIDIELTPDLCRKMPTMPLQM